MVGKNSLLFFFRIYLGIQKEIWINLHFKYTFFPPILAQTIDMKKSLANIRFIGELYKCQILTDRKMHEIIRRLLLPIEPDENSVELLCCLLKSIGEKLELRTHQKISTGDVSYTVSVNPRF